MMFNDDFLEEEYTNLPHYDGTEMLPVRHGTTNMNGLYVIFYAVRVVQEKGDTRWD